MADPHLLFEVFSNDQASGVAYKNRLLKKLIINYLDITGNVTIAELSKELNISTPKITNLTAELTEDGLLKIMAKLNLQEEEEPACTGF